MGLMLPGHGSGRTPCAATGGEHRASTEVEGLTSVSASSAPVPNRRRCQHRPPQIRFAADQLRAAQQGDHHLPSPSAEISPIPPLYQAGALRRGCATSPGRRFRWVAADGGRGMEGGNQIRRGWCRSRSSLQTACGDGSGVRGEALRPAERRTFRAQIGEGGSDGATTWACSRRFLSHSKVSLPASPARGPGSSSQGIGLGTPARKHQAFRG